MATAGSPCWRIHLAPVSTGSIRSAVMRVADDATPEEVMQCAALRWPGAVLDVVSPGGKTYLRCAVPPWYQTKPTT